MANRNRTIYNVLALYASTGKADSDQNNANALKQFSRVQSFDEDFTRNFTDVNQYGNLAAIDRIEVEAPDVKGSFEYFVTNGENEKFLGLTVANSGTLSTNLVSCISGILNKSTDEKNYYLMIADEGSDAANYTKTNTGVIGLGNAFLTSYSINAAVGEIPKASVDLEALNVRVYGTVDSGSPVPGINATNGTSLTGIFMLPLATSMTGTSQYSALRPGDITLSMTGANGFNNDNLKVQDFTLSFDLARTPLQKLGNRFAFAREINFPVTASLEVNAEVGEIVSGNLADLLCNNPTHNFEITMAQPGCGTIKSGALAYLFKGAKLTSQSFSSAIGSNATLKASFEVQIGSAEQKDIGIFISGSFA